MQKEIVKKMPMLGSSQDPEKLALRVKSALYAIIPAVVVVCKMLGVDLVNGDLQVYADALYNVIVYGGFLVAGVLHLWGWIRMRLNR